MYFYNLHVMEYISAYIFLHFCCTKLPIAKDDFSSKTAFATLYAWTNFAQNDFLSSHVSEPVSMVANGFSLINDCYIR